MIKTYLDEIRIIYKTHLTKEEVLQDLSRNKNRSKVELIKWNNQKAIKKTFKKEFSRFAQREIDFLKNRKLQNFTPQLLDYGQNYFITNFYEKPSCSIKKTNCP